MYVVLAIAAVVVCWPTALRIPAIIAAVLLIWAVGVIHNFKDNPYDAPDWTAKVGIPATVVLIGLLVGGFILR